MLEQQYFYKRFFHAEVMSANDVISPKLFSEKPWPLMSNNITRQDLDTLIDFLKQEDPILTQSSQVRAFEQEWSHWLGVKHSVFVNSGSSANLLTLAALREHHGLGEIIVPPLTWVSDIASVLQTGYTPVFADISQRTLGMDSQEVIKKTTHSTKAVFLTHILGYNALDDALLSHLREKNIPLIEDACESHGTTFKGQNVGTFGLMSNFSFYYAHHMSTIEGGMISTNDESLYQTVRMFRSHGMVRESTSSSRKEHYCRNYPDLNPDFIFAFPAYNMRSTELNAVLGRSQLTRLNENNAKRKENLNIFLDSLDSKRYTTEFEREGNSNYAFTLVLRHPDTALRDRVMDALRKNRIEFRRGTSGGGNQLRQPYLRKRFPDIAPEAYPNAEHVHFYGFYIGNYPSLEQPKIKKLCRLVNSI